MAKEAKQALTPEEKKREKERLEKDKREKAELDKIKKDKLNKQKRKTTRAKKKQKEEIKRVKTLVNLPFKLLWHISLIVTLLSAIVLLFWIEVELKTGLIYLFFVFISVYFGVGSIMVAFFYMLSEDKKNELMEGQRLEIEKIVKEEQRKKDEESLRLQEIEKEMASRKFENAAKGALPMHDEEFDEDNEGMPAMLGESSESTFEMPDFGSGSSEDEMIFETPNDTGGLNEDSINSGNNNYYDEIFDPNFKP